MLLSNPTLKQTDGWIEYANVTSLHSVCLLTYSMEQSPS
jgi:hypothetical protein